MRTPRKFQVHLSCSFIGYGNSGRLFYVESRQDELAPHCFSELITDMHALDATSIRPSLASLVDEVKLYLGPWFES